MAAKARPAPSQRPPPASRQRSYPTRKSLKQSLKDVFLRATRKSPPPSDTVGSGILRRAEFNKSHFPSTTTLNTFSDHLASQYSLEGYTISRSIPNRFQSPTFNASSQSAARQSLLPATSLSQFNLHQAYLNPTTVPQRSIHDAISTRATSVASRQASVATFSTVTTVKSNSTLRIQESRQSLRPSASRSTGHASAKGAPRTTRKNHVSWLQSPTASSVSLRDAASILETHVGEPPGVKSVEHFKSFCILDTAIPGCPVVATSRELCYIFEIGENFVLNNTECQGASMDIVTGQDAAGDPITHLVLFTPLVIPSSGRSRFMLACLVDVTRFINETATIPDLDKDYDSSTIESELQTPLRNNRGPEWHGTSYQLSADSLLGGCMLPDDRVGLTKSRAYDDPADDIWLNLAKEEENSKPSWRNTPRSTPRSNHTPRSTASQGSAASSNVDEVLSEFMNGLQELYSEFFLLAKSPLNETCFEICNVSPVLYQLKDYIDGHLSRTAPQQMAELSAALARGSPFNLPVKWGLQGLDKRLYCSPMYTANSITWICFLVDHQMPLLW
jgi:hypothetical protein